jgi:peroxiredoxin
MLRTRLSTILALALATPFDAATAYAALNVGATAPEFTAPASLGGTEFDFTLSAALKSGPVVLYFYPAAFTSGCTVEAHDFAEATDKFKEMGATVIGISHDSIETLNKFAVSECRSKFAVAADKDLSIAKAYDSVIWYMPFYSNRTSYVIAPDGKILLAYTAMDPGEHVSRTMKAVADWKAAH